PVLVNSSADGVTRSGDYAAVGANQIFTSSLQLAQDGSYKGMPTPNVTHTNGPQMPDPTMTMNFGKQPRVKTVAEVVAATPGFVMAGVTAPLDGAVLGPGVYVGGFPVYPPKGQPFWHFSEAPVVLKNVTFKSPAGQAGTFIFLGGLDVQNATFDQGVYV